MQEDERAQHFVEVLLPAFEQAASIAMALQGRVDNRPKASEVGDEKAALTVADTAAQEALLVPLVDRFADCALEAEEDTPSVASFRGGDTHRRIVIDPIDGTFHFYLGAKGPYAVMAGFALDASYHAALVAVPTLGWVFSAQRGQGARRTPIPASGEFEAEAARSDSSSEARGVLVSDTTPARVREVLGEGGFVPVLASGGAISVAPFLPEIVGGLRFSNRRSHQGISARGRVGLLIAREGGARVCTASGGPFPDSIDAPAETLVVARDARTADALCVAARAGEG